MHYEHAGAREGIRELILELGRGEGSANFPQLHAERPSVRSPSEDAVLYFRENGKLFTVSDFATELIRLAGDYVSPRAG